MKLRREFTGAVSEEDAHARLVKLLKQMKYREQRSPANHLMFVRGKPNSSLFALRPRSFHATLHAWIYGGPEESKIVIELEVPKVFQPPHQLAVTLYEAELDDLENGVMTNLPGTINRYKQNKMAGNAYLVVLITGIGITFGVARLAGPHDSWEGGLAWLACYIGWIYFCGRLPLPLLEFELHHPKGAKIISDEPEPEVAPKPARAKSQA